MKPTYLEQGKQTQMTALVKGHASKARSFPVSKTDLENIHQRLGIDISLEKISPTLAMICRTAGYIATLRPIDGYIRDPATDEALRQNAELKGRICYKRTLDQVLGEGIFPSAPDYALVFRGLMVAQKVRTSYILAIHETSLLDPQSTGKPCTADVSHTFCCVFTLGGGYYVDPTSPPRIMKKDADLLPFVVWKEGLDSWSLDVRDTKDIMESVKDKETRYKLLSKYETALESRIDQVRSLQTLMRPRLPSY
jgi:hypothetical protein